MLKIHHLRFSSAKTFWEWVHSALPYPNPILHGHLLHPDPSLAGKCYQWFTIKNSSTPVHTQVCLAFFLALVLYDQWHNSGLFLDVAVCVYVYWFDAVYELSERTLSLPNNHQEPRPCLVSSLPGTIGITLQLLSSALSIRSPNQWLKKLFISTALQRHLLITHRI